MSRHQVTKMINHTDSPYIRGIGFLYLRFRCVTPTGTFHEPIIFNFVCSLPPEYLLQFFGDYLQDEEPVDPKAGGGDPMTIGQMVQQMLEENQWYGVMFPRIPAKHLKEIRDKIRSIRGGTSKEPDRRRWDRSRSPQSKKKRRDPRDIGDEPTNRCAFAPLLRSDFLEIVTEAVAVSDSTITNVAARRLPSEALDTEKLFSQGRTASLVLSMCVTYHLAQIKPKTTESSKIIYQPFRNRCKNGWTRSSYNSGHLPGRPMSRVLKNY